MTVKEKIKELNTTFQKSYYDQSLSYFSHDAPAMIEEMLVLINTIADKYEMQLTLKDTIKLLQDQINDLKSVTIEKTDDAKDAWLIPVKKNVSGALWRFHRKLWNFRESILNEEI